jgi:hypothetical protein
VTQEQELAQLSPIQPNLKKIVPMAIGDHWMAGILREDTITIMDSDFAETRMLRVKEACRGNARIKVRYAVNTAQQPMGSSQCALHCIMNAILLYFDCAEFAPQKRTWDLEPFREVFRTGDIQTILGRSIERVDIPILSLETSDRVLWMHQGEVWKGYVKASRRGMRMVRGMKLGHEELNPTSSFVVQTLRNQNKVGLHS